MSVCDPCRLSIRDFRRLAGFVEEFIGIHLPQKKQTLVESRLRKRLAALSMDSYSQYADHVLNSAQGALEVPYLVDTITTHKTDFFREPHHFEFLTKRIIPELNATLGAGTRRPLRVWSAGCSSGEEAYSLAMTLCEVAREAPEYCFRVLATDVSQGILRDAMRGVYPVDAITPVQHVLRTRYLMRGVKSMQSHVKVAPELSSNVDFRCLNLIKPFEFKDSMDVVLCRNVLIYFDKEQCQDIVGRICETMSPGGYLMLGHSESIQRIDVPLESVGSTIYRLRR